MTTTYDRPPRGWNLAQTLLGGLALLGACATLALGWHAAEALSRLGATQAAHAASIGADRFSAGLFEVLMERLATNNALQAPAVAGPEALAEIARRRAAVAADFDPGRTTLLAQDFPNRAELVRSLDAALAKADAARRQADAAIGQPREARDPALLRDYIPTITASVDAALKLWFSALHAISADDAAASRLAVIKEIGWRLRDTAGFERSNIASAIAAGQPVAPDRLAANAAIRGRVDLLWDVLNNLAPDADAATPPALRAAMAEARRRYFGDFRTLADEMVRAGAAAPGGRYPMPAAAFVDATTPQLGTLLGVMHAAGEASRAHEAAAMRDIRNEALLTLASLLATLATAVGLGVLIRRRVLRPIRALEVAATGLAAGDLETPLPPVAGHGRNEVGRLAAAMAVLREGLVERRQLRAAQEAERQATERAKAAALAAMARRFEADTDSAVGTIRGRATGMAQEAREVADSARRVAGAAEDLADTAGRSLANTQQAASAAEELAGSVHEISTRVHASAGIVRRAVESTSAGQETIRGLAGTVTRIGEVARLIADIAGRTNLLALNATIEAARAGEAGKGFAVVASEVKALAQQTATATEEIAGQIVAVTNATDDAVEAVRMIGVTVREMDESAAAIAAAVEQQAATTQEIARSVAETASAGQDIARRTAEVSEEMGATDRRAKAMLAAVEAIDASLGAMRDDLVGRVRMATEGRDAA